MIFGNLDTSSSDLDPGSATNAFSYLGCFSYMVRADQLANLEFVRRFAPIHGLNMILMCSSARSWALVRLLIYKCRPFHEESGPCHQQT